ncbi:MAG TPA: beta-propeller domain-containing protein [Xanthomonadaceae bacterium]|jgi:hypothetical protein
MTRKLAGTILLLLCMVFATTPAAAAHGRSLQALHSDAEFSALLAKWKQKAQRQLQAPTEAPMSMAANAAAPPSPPMQALPMGAVADMKAKDLDKAEVAISGVTGAAITNVQTQGVDEGDIVKQYGDYLIVLRRGRLFTVRIGGDALQPASAVNAYAPDVDPDGTWYDEMLIADGRIAVIGYSYARGGTEIGLFDLDHQGRIHYRSTYQMRSSDYYSSRNYASRLIGHQLIFYAPMPVDPWGDPYSGFPALRHWRNGATPADFHRILPATRIYRSGADLDPNDGITLHSVSICNLDAPEMSCRSTAVLGPSGRVFYVSADSVYVWTSSWRDHAVGSSSLFRIPLDGSAPSGLRATGSPIDQMSFLQRDGWLNVLLNREGNGEGMWAANDMAGSMALLRLRLADFGDGSDTAPRRDYRVLPDATSQWGLQNRYVGDWLVYGSPGSDVAHAFRFAAPGPVQDVKLDHPVERIDALGDDAILVGSHGGDLHFTSVALRREAKVASTYVQPNAAQGDARTHGFFYRPDDEGKGIVGLPIVRGGDGSAAVLYLRNLALRLSRMGSLDSKAGVRIDDACKASCVDWYGNARPIFVGDRVFALLGYELVEGRIAGGAIGERRRADFAPATAVARVAP